jgi:hypothetical protein
MRPNLGRAEHISLAAEADDAAPVRAKQAKVLATFALKSGFRGLSTSLSLLDTHVLEIDTRRPGESARSYSVDLRYLNAKPVRVRSIAWIWAIDTFALLILAAVKFWRASTLDSADALGPLSIGAGAAIAACITAAWFVRSTTESLSFISTIGAVPLVEVTGGIGSGKAGKKFFVQLIKTIMAAKTLAPTNKHQYLRDEMREHHRLHEAGALNDELYELGKARVLESF